MLQIKNEEKNSRRKFYLKNGFTSSNLYIAGHSGNMEIMNYGGIVSREEYMKLQKYALGASCFYCQELN